MPNTSRTSLISGGHRGAEAEFGRCAKRWGIDQTTLSFEGHAMEWPVGVKVLGEAELAAGDISKRLGIPEGTAVSLPLRARGASVRRCAGYAILTSVPQPLLMLRPSGWMPVVMTSAPSSLKMSGAMK